MVEHQRQIAALVLHRLPQFAQLTMVPQPLELNVIGEGAAQWWETMDRRPIVRKMFALFLLVLIGATVWFIFFE